MPMTDDAFDHDLDDIPVKPENPGIYATLDGYVTPSGYGYYNHEAQLEHFETPSEAYDWLAAHAPPGQRLATMVPTNRSDHPMGWFSVPAEMDQAYAIAQAVNHGFRADIAITLHQAGSLVDHDNWWVTIDQNIFVPQWEDIT